MTASIDTVLTLDQLSSRVMPIRSVEDGHVFGVELLARGPEGSPYEQPEHFFREARRQGCLPLIDFRCIAKAVSLLSRFPPRMRVFINAYPDTVLHREFVPWMEQLLDDLPADGPKICLEIHESLGLHQLAPMADPLLDLRNLGLEIALDDLRPDDLTPTHWILKPDFLKCDRSVISQLSPGEFEFYITYLKRFEDIHGCGLIIEGIETDEQLDALRKLGVRYAQGYIYGPPAAIEESNGTGTQSLMV